MDEDKKVLNELIDAWNNLRQNWEGNFVEIYYNRYFTKIYEGMNNLEDIEKKAIDEIEVFYKEINKYKNMD